MIEVVPDNNYILDQFERENERQKRIHRKRKVRDEERFVDEDKEKGD
jgi:hypothetical protein